MAELDNEFSLGTLMWIGDPSHREFCELFSYCSANASQLAVRESIAEAVHRRAACVDRIVLTQTTRDTSDWHLVDHVLRANSQAKLLQVSGTLCEGMRKPLVSQAGCQTICWHQWQQVIPQWLGDLSDFDDEVSSSPNRLAIVTASYSQAEPLLDLAEATGAMATWCRQPNVPGLRNIDTVWWDDSIATPSSVATWRRRIDTFSSIDQPVRHAWIANTPRHHQCITAVAGGVDLIVSKPHRIGGLLSMLRPPRTAATEASSPLQRRAA